MSSVIEIEVINWEKYNPRSDRANHSWFRMQNNIATEPKFHGLSAAQKFIAICIFAEVSKSGGKQTTIYLDWLCDQLKVKPKEVVDTINDLVSRGVFRLPEDTSCLPTVSELPATNGRTDERNERTNNNAQKRKPAAQPEGFAEFYLGYPRKVGKTAAIKAWRRVASEPGFSFADLLAARGKYREHLEAQGTDAKFVQHPATFLSSWRDWLDPSAGTSDLKKPDDLSHIDWEKYGDGTDAI